jgi:predicted RNA-binding Zn ribbon-like protein
MAAPLLKALEHDLVLDFLNTVMAEDKPYGEVLRSDEDVVVWLKEAGFWDEHLMWERALGELAAAARSLRELIRELIQQRKADEKVEIARLNAQLVQCSYTMELVKADEDELKAVRRFSQDTAEQVLAPIALAAAELLANADFRLVRKCEGDECPRWFYDRTKAHRRRWCNMAVCGNRNKATRFRTGAKVDQEL